MAFKAGAKDVRDNNSNIGKSRLSAEKEKVKAQQSKPIKEEVVNIVAAPVIEIVPPKAKIIEQAPPLHPKLAFAAAAVNAGGGGGGYLTEYSKRKDESAGKKKQKKSGYDKYADNDDDMSSRGRQEVRSEGGIGYGGMERNRYDDDYDVLSVPTGSKLPCLSPSKPKNSRNTTMSAPPRLRDDSSNVVSLPPPVRVSHDYGVQPSAQPRENRRHK
jgi:hypothetical protein